MKTWGRNQENDYLLVSSLLVVCTYSPLRGCLVASVAGLEPALKHAAERLLPPASSAFAAATACTEPPSALAELALVRPFCY